MDANNFELINQSDNNHQMINESCIYNKDYLDLDTSQEDNRPGQTPGDDVVAQEEPDDYGEQTPSDFWVHRDGDSSARREGSQQTA